MTNTSAQPANGSATEQFGIEYLSYRKARRTDDLGIITDHDDYLALDALLTEAANVPTGDTKNHTAYVISDETLRQLVGEQFGHDECDTCRQLGTLVVAFSDWKAMLGHDVLRKPW